MKLKLLAAGCVFFGTLLTGCAGNGALYVRTAPPAPRYGVVGVAPGPGYVWTDGYWDWRGGGWYWRDGRWMRPPHRHATWVPDRWENRGRNRYAFRRGHWR